MAPGLPSISSKQLTSNSPEYDGFDAGQQSKLALRQGKAGGVGYNFDQWWWGFKDKIFSPKAVGEAFLLSALFSTSIRATTPLLQTGLMKLGIRGGLPLLLSSALVLSTGSSFFMTAYQMKRQGLEGADLFLKQWFCGTLQSLPSVVLAMILGRGGFGQKFVEDLALEPVHAVIATAMGGALESVGLKPQLSLNWSERYAIELVEGIFSAGVSGASTRMIDFGLTTFNGQSPFGYQLVEGLEGYERVERGGQPRDPQAAAALIPPKVHPANILMASMVGANGGTGPGQVRIDVDKPFIIDNETGRTLAAGKVITHPRFGRGEIVGMDHEESTVWVRFPNDTVLALDPISLLRMKESDCRVDTPRIVYPPDALIKEALERDLSPYEVPCIYYGGELFLLLRPRTIGGRQLREEYHRNKMVRYHESIHKRGFDPQFPVPVYWLPTKQFVAVDGHHRVRAAGSVIKRHDSLTLVGIPTDRILVRVVREEGLDLLYSGLTSQKLYEQFNESARDFMREFLPFDISCLQKFYGAQPCVIAGVQEARVFHSRPYLYPHVGSMSYNPEYASRTNQDGLVRVLDDQMNPTFWVMDGLGGHSRSEEAVDITGYTLRDAIPFGTSMREASLQANQAVNAFNHSLSINAATTLTGVRIFEEGGQKFAEFLGIGDSYGMVIRSKDGHLIRHFLCDRHTRLVYDDPKLQVPQSMNQELVDSVVGVGTPSIANPTVPLRPGDYLFLCDDGIMKNVHFAEITEILKSSKDLVEFSDRLRDLVHQRMMESIAYQKSDRRTRQRLKGSWAERAVPDDLAFWLIAVPE